MPLKLTTPETIIQVKNEVWMQDFSIDLINGILMMTVAEGTRDVNGTFIQVGPLKLTKISGQKFIDILTRYPQLYVDLRNALYSELLRENPTYSGTMV